MPDTLKKETPSTDNRHSAKEDNRPFAGVQLAGDAATNPDLETKTDEDKLGVGQIINKPLQDALAKHVTDCYNQARYHRRYSGVSEILLRNMRARKCQYQPDEREMLAEGIDVYIGLAALKAAAAESWLLDIIVNNIEKPWTLSATPEPDLPPKLKAQVIEQLLQELPSMNSFDALRDRAEQLKSVVQGLAQKASRYATERMETHISDQMDEGDWTNTFSRFVSDLTVFPTALMRGPVKISKPQTAWDGQTLTAKTKPLLTVRSVSPFNAFPAPNSETPQDGEYFIEAVPFGGSDLHALLDAPAFTASAIRAVLDKYPDGYAPHQLQRQEQDVLQDKSNNTGTSAAGYHEYEVVIYNGKVKGKLLIDKGAMVPDPQKLYEAEIWVVEDYVIRAVLNPDPTGRRPVFGTSYRKVNGSFWGQSVIDVVYDVQRVCNAAARAIVRNMGYASGPMGEVVSERLADGESAVEVAPYKLYRVGPDLTGTGAPAIRFHNITMVAPGLLGIYERFSKIADDLSGIPSYVLGNPSVAGAGRTLGGLSMLMGNAAKGIKNVQLNIDHDVISPLVHAFYTYNMLTSTDMGIKADAKVIARGATGLLQRELSQSRSVELLHLLTPYAQSGLVTPNALILILRDIFKNTGMDVDKIFPDPDAEAAHQNISNLLGNGQAEAMQRGTSTPVPLPPQSQRPPRPANLSPVPTPVNLAQGA